MTTAVEGGTLALTVEAVYENGVLKPAQPLPFQEHDEVQVTIHARPNGVEETAGIIGWKGSPEELRYFALDPDLDPEEGA